MDNSMTPLSGITNTTLVPRDEKDQWAQRRPQIQRNISNSSWNHLVAGASGGMTTALITSPLDVLRTRLQADFYRTARSPLAHSIYSLRTPLSPLWEACNLLSSIKHQEGWSGFFRGLGPSVTGVVPATAIKFYTYGNCKELLQGTADLNENSVILHISAAASAGFVTSTATNPIWLVKTRLQLDKSRTMQNNGSLTHRQYKNSVDCVRQVLQREGLKGLYRGLTASYLGAVETTIHLTLYEQLKVAFKDNKAGSTSLSAGWFSVTGAAGASKLIATLLAYPHEVIRTRLRQAPMENGLSKYRSVVQCCRLVIREEGFRSMYGGLTPHLLRAIPSAIITLSVYEFVLGLLKEAP